MYVTRKTVVTNSWYRYNTIVQITPTEMKFELYNWLAPVRNFVEQTYLSVSDRLK